MLDKEIEDFHCPFCCRVNLLTAVYSKYFLPSPPNCREERFIELRISYVGITMSQKFFVVSNLNVIVSLIC